MTTRSRTSELVAVALAIAMLMFVEILGQRTTTSLVDTARAVQHTREIIEQLDDLLIAHLDAETGRRGFALTGDEAQLAPYHHASARAFARLSDLRALISDSPEQLKRLDTLDPLVRGRLDALDRAVAAQRKEGFIEREREADSTAMGRHQMESVRAVVAAMIGEARRVLAAREQKTGERAHEVRVVQLVGTALSAGIFLLAIVRLRREAQRRRRSEILARDNEQDLATTLHSIGDGVIATDAEGRVRRMNPVAEALTGWAIADARGRSSAEVFHLVNERSGKDATDPIAKALREGKVVEIDDAAVLVAKDGTRRRVADSAAPIRGVGDEIRGAVLVFHDITKILEDARSLRRAHAFLNSVVDNIPNMVFVKDAQELAFVRINRAGEILLGAKREELVGKTDFAFFPADQAKAFVEKDRETLRSKTVLDIPEEPVATPKGIRWLHTMKVPIDDEAGEPEYLLGISEDITERRRADVTLRASMDATEVAHRELESFSYSVAHDLRAPLRSIDGFSQALLDDYSDKLDAQGKDYLSRVRNGARRMAELIDDLLALARVSRTELARSDVDISAVARQVGEEASKRGCATAQLDVAPGLEASADARLVRVLLENLLANAFKFSAKRTDALIEVGMRQEGASDVFFVRDNGAGFDSGAAKKLFTAFQRYHRPTEYEGTGIGLATAERIVSRHGGRIWAESKPDAGATFFFILERGGGT